MTRPHNIGAADHAPLPLNRFFACETCNGTGSHYQAVCYAGEAYGEQIELACEDCDGTGETDPCCDYCDGPINELGWCAACEEMTPLISRGVAFSQEPLVEVEQLAERDGHARVAL